MLYNDGKIDIKKKKMQRKSWTMGRRKVQREVLIVFKYFPHVHMYLIVPMIPAPYFNAMLLHLFKQVLKHYLFKSMAKSKYDLWNLHASWKEIEFSKLTFCPEVSLLHLMFVSRGFHVVAAPTFTIVLLLLNLTTFYSLFQ